MGALVPRSSLVVSFLLLLLPTAAYCFHVFEVSMFTNKNCSAGESDFLDIDFSSLPRNATTDNTTQPFQSVILYNVSNNIQQLSACQLGFDCNATGAILIPLNGSVTPSPCSTAGPPGTLFNRFFFIEV